MLIVTHEQHFLPYFNRVLEVLSRLLTNVKSFMKYLLKEALKSF